MKLKCAICNRKLEEGRYVYSRFTKQRYCIDFERHNQIVRKRKREEARKRASSLSYASRRSTERKS